MNGVQQKLALFDFEVAFYCKIHKIPLISPPGYGPPGYRPIGLVTENSFQLQHPPPGYTPPQKPLQSCISPVLVSRSLWHLKWTPICGAQMNLGI